MILCKKLQLDALGGELERTACLEHLSVFERTEGEERGVCAKAQELLL